MANKMRTYEKISPTLAALLREELKSRKLARIFRQLGVGEQCPWLPSFNEHIAQSLRLDTDESFRKYDALMEELAQEINSLTEIDVKRQELMSRLATADIL
jgi:hypothetical protein